MKKNKIIIKWTCSDYCKKEHHYKFIATIHGKWLYFIKEILKLDFEW